MDTGLDISMQAEHEEPPILAPVLTVGVSPVPGAISCIAKDTVAYVSGHCVSTCCVNSSHMSHISEPLPSVKRIMAMASSQDKQWLAIAEISTNDPPRISILKSSGKGRLERHVLSSWGGAQALATTPGCSTINHISFSSDSNTIIASCYDDSVGSEPSSSSPRGEKPLTTRVMTWEWQSDHGHEPSGSFDVQGRVIKVSIHPKYSSNVMTMTQDELLLWRRGSAGFRRQDIEGSSALLFAGAKDPSAFATPQVTFIDHAWLSDGRLAVATSGRRIAVVDGSTVTEVHEIGRAINCLLSLHENMVLVSLAKGGLACYLADKEHGKMEVLSVLHVPETALSCGGSEVGVTHMSASFASLKSLGGMSAGSLRRRSSQGLIETKATDMVVETVACYVNHGPILILDVSLALGASLSAKDDSHEMFEEALPSTHFGPVSSISCAANRSIVATCSSDDVTVRVWEYSPLRQVLTHNCHHAPLAVGIDPWGRELVVCYVDCCRCYSIVEGSLLEVSQMTLETPFGPEEMTKCCMVKYTPTGHLIAVVGGDRCKDVVIFSTLYHKPLATLHGHYSPIVDMAWSADGLLLTTVAENEVFTWHMETFEKVQSHSIKTFNNNAVVCSRDFKTIVAGDGGQGLKILATNRSNLGRAAHASFSQAVAMTPGEGAGGGGGGGSRTKEPLARPSIVWSEGVEASSPSLRVDVELASPSFVVPGKAHLARLASAEKRAMLSMSPSMIPSTDKSPRKGGANMDASRSLPPPPTSLSFPASDLINTSLLPAAVNPAKACLTLLEYPGSDKGSEKGWRALVGSQSLGQGRARVCNLPSLPSYVAPGDPPPEVYDAIYQEYTLHSSEITSMVSHPNGRILFSADSSGVWKLHLLLPPPPTLPAMGAPIASSPSGRNLARSPTGLTKSLKKALSMKNLSLAAAAQLSRPRAILPPFNEIMSQCAKAVNQLMPRERDLSSEFVSVRSADLRHLRDNARELKDKLSKQAHQAEFLVYQKEQDVKRELEGELTRWRREAEENGAALLAVRNQLQESKLSHAAAEELMRRSLNEALEDERDVFMSKLSQEVERTTDAEMQVDKMRVKFGKRLWEVEEERAANVKASQGLAKDLEAQSEDTKRRAQSEIAKARELMAIEATIDMEWNEEDISRVNAQTSSALSLEHKKLEELLAKHTLQTGLYHKTLQDNQELKESNEALKAEQLNLTHQVLGLSEELDAMHRAWMERDGRQRAMDNELKELMSRMQQANVFTALANSRIAELHNELEPVKAAKAEAQELVAKLENLQVRQAERRLAQNQELNELKARYDRLREDSKSTRRKMEVREEYFANFTTQLFRLVSSVDHHQWPTVFGKLVKDYQAGKDLADWSRYLPDHSGTSSGAALKKQAGEKQQHLAMSRSTTGVIDPLATATSVSLDSLPAGGSPTAAVAHVPPAPVTSELQFQEQMKELQAQVKHLERLLTSAKESREKSESSQKTVIHRLVQENSSILEEANILKRDLRSAKEASDKLSVEVRMLQAQLAQANGAAGFAGPGGGAEAGGMGSRPPSWRAPPQHRLASAGRRPSDPDLLNSSLSRELSSSELIAAAAANNTLPSPRGGAESHRPSTSQNSSRIPQAIPEDSPLKTSSVLDSPSSMAAPSPVAQQASAGSRPSSSTVTGEMPSGGWWLGEGSPFEVPASLNTILKGGNPSSPNSALLPSSAHHPGGQGARVGSSRPGSRAGPLSSSAPPPSSSQQQQQQPANSQMVSTPITSSLIPRTPSLNRQAQPVITRPGTSTSSTPIGGPHSTSNDVNATTDSSVGGHNEAIEVPSSVSMMASFTNSMRGGTAPAQMASYHSGPGGFMGIKRGITPTAGSITSRPGYYPPGSSQGVSSSNPYQSSGSVANKGAGGSRGGSRTPASKSNAPRSLEVGGLGLTSPQHSPSMAHDGSWDQVEDEDGEDEEARPTGDRSGKPPRVHVLPKAFLDNLIAKSPNGKSPSSPNVKMASLGAGFRSFQPRKKDY